jgi:hypothetical protein
MRQSAILVFTERSDASEFYSGIHIALWRGGCSNLDLVFSVSEYCGENELHGILMLELAEG